MLPRNCHHTTVDQLISQVEHVLENHTYDQFAQCAFQWTNGAVRSAKGTQMMDYIKKQEPFVLSDFVVKEIAKLITSTQMKEVAKQIASEESKRVQFVTAFFYDSLTSLSNDQIGALTPSLLRELYHTCPPQNHAKLLVEALGKRHVYDSIQQLLEGSKKKGEKETTARKKQGKTTDSDKSTPLRKGKKQASPLVAKSEKRKKTRVQKVASPQTRTKKKETHISSSSSCSPKKVLVSKSKERHRKASKETSPIKDKDKKKSPREKKKSPRKKVVETDVGFAPTLTPTLTGQGSTVSNKVTSDNAIVPNTAVPGAVENTKVQSRRRDSTLNFSDDLFPSPKHSSRRTPFAESPPNMYYRRLV